MLDAEGSVSVFAPLLPGGKQQGVVGVVFSGWSVDGRRTSDTLADILLRVMRRPLTTFGLLFMHTNVLSYDSSVHAYLNYPL